MNRYELTYTREGATRAAKATLSVLAKNEARARGKAPQGAKNIEVRQVSHLSQENRDG